MKTRMYKTLALLLTFNFSLLTAFGQSPQKVSYQAVVRDASDNLVSNTQVGMQISILQSTASGTAVYVETHTPTTNANGLVSIEIGGGTVVSGNFTAIDWAGDTYFVKTETDPAGGTAYSITGTSQLLSVPYALHAKTAETVTGTITESDPVYNASEAANITATHITNLGNLSGTNTGDQDLSGIGTNTQAIQDTASQIRADIPDVSGFVTTETDPVYTAWNKDYADLTNKPVNATTTTDGFMSSADKTKLDGLSKTLSLSQTSRDALTPTEGLIVYNTTTHKPNYYNGTEWMNYDGTSAKTKVGDFLYGGVVFYIFQPVDAGYVAGETHGLVCAVSDQSTGAQWGCYGTEISGADGTAVGTGAQNTANIEAGCTTAGTAADICANLTLNGYNDWFLPSKDELNKMYQNKATIDATAGANGGNSFASAYYWSSTQHNNDGAWTQAFVNGDWGLNFKVNTGRVRAVRAF